MESGNSNTQNVSSTASAPPESSFSAPPPPYSEPTQYPPTYGMPYHHHYPHSTPVADYPKPYGPPSGGQPYYQPPGVVYPGPPGTYSQAPQPQQQHQQQVIVVNNQPMAPVFVVGGPPVSMVGAIVLSCLVFWSCGNLFGGIAFILAIIGQSAASAGDNRGAIHWRNASYGLSIAGIVIGIIIIIVIVCAVATRTSSVYEYSYQYKQCYDSYLRTYYLCIN